jgi:SAM-dependent methyltransferase
LEPVPLGNKRLLDLGCGNGQKLTEFTQRGYDVWGVDIGADSIRNCREILPQGHFIQSELQETGLPDGFFHLIRIDNTLEHVPNPKEVVGECYRLLRRGGKLFVFVPHGGSLSIRIMKGNSISAWIPFHLQLFTYKSLGRLIEDAGFKQMKIYGYNPTSWLPLSLLQWRNKDHFNLKYGHPSWLNLLCYPIGWLAAKLWIGEELIAISVKK